VILRFARISYLVAAVTALTGLSQAEDQSPLPRVGVLLATDRSQAGLRQALNDLGYVEGKNIVVDWRIASQGYERLQALAADLVQSKPDVILAGGDGASRAAMQATKSIPLVFTSGDPIVAGYAKSLSHPGRNATGVYVPSPQLTAKRLELLMELVPRARRIVYLGNPSNPLAELELEQVERAAKALNVQLVRLDIRKRDEINNALKRVSRKTADAGLVSTDVVLASASEEIVRAFRAARLPAVYPWRPYVEQGGLMYYGVPLQEIYRSAALYADRILKGAKPNDLPVEELSKFELVLNMREAERLGIQVPQSLRARVTEAIR